MVERTAWVLGSGWPTAPCTVAGQPGPRGRNARKHVVSRWRRDGGHAPTRLPLLGDEFAWATTTTISFASMYRLALRPPRTCHHLRPVNGPPGALGTLVLDLAMAVSDSPNVCLFTSPKKWQLLKESRVFAAGIRIRRRTCENPSSRKSGAVECNGCDFQVKCRRILFAAISHVLFALNKRPSPLVLQGGGVQHSPMRRDEAIFWMDTLASGQRHASKWEYWLRRETVQIQLSRADRWSFERQSAAGQGGRTLLQERWFLSKRKRESERIHGSFRCWERLGRVVLVETLRPALRRRFAEQSESANP